MKDDVTIADSEQLVKSAGADAVFDYKLSVGEQIAEIERSTRGNFTRVFDASAFAGEAAMAAFAASKSTEQKYFATTNDWFVLSDASKLNVLI